MAEKNGRQLNYEVLRILAMLMIVCLHYLSKGGFLGVPAREHISMSGYAAWLIEAFCLVAVNVYVLISGYFGGGSETKDVLKRPFTIWKQVFFYSVAIGIIAAVTGIYQSDTHQMFAGAYAGMPRLDMYQIFTYIFPIVTEHYWFATSYIILCLFMPFLDKGANALDQKSFAKLLGGFLLIFSVAKTVIPMQLAWDKYGYDAFWFVTLYLTGAYIRRFGVAALCSRARAAALYVGCALLTFASFLIIRKVFFAIGSLEAFVNYAYTYNHVLCYLGAVGLFMAFQENANKSSNEAARRLERFRRPIVLVSGATFGVYLIHEHINIRYLWLQWFDCAAWVDAPLPSFLGHMILTVFTVFVVCTLIEIARKKAAVMIGKRR